MSRASWEQFARLGASVGATEIGWRTCQALKQSLTCQVIEGVSGAESLSWQTAVHNEKKIRRQTPLNPRLNGRRPEGRTNDLSVFWGFSMRAIIDVPCYPPTRLAAAHLQKNCEKLQTISLVLTGADPRRDRGRGFQVHSAKREFCRPSYSHAIAGSGVLGNVGLDSRLPWIQQGFFHRTVNSGSSRRRVLLLAFVCGNR